MRCFLMLLVLAGGVSGGEVQNYSFGPLTELRTDEGPISFGLVVSADVVAWSAPDAKDLLITRCWEGVLLYPSKDLKTFGEPIELCGSFRHSVLMIEPLDWDGDGREEAMGTDRNGNIFCLKRVGEYPNIRLEMAQDPLVTPEGLAFNIPFVNPKFRLSDQAEYIRPEYFNYIYPTKYPLGGGSGDLILGDWGGALWGMPWKGLRDGLPLYPGVEYAKRDGKVFAKPAMHLGDERGEELLLGEAKDAGVRYPGGSSRPVWYKNGATGSDDLLVYCGMTGNVLRYLQRKGTALDGGPVFKDLGEVRLEGFPYEEFDAYSYHAVVAVTREGADADLLVSRGSSVGLFEFTGYKEGKPGFRLSHWLSGKDVPTRGYNFTEILKHQEGRRYLLENDNEWSFRELLTEGGEVRLSSTMHPLNDQNGRFQVEGETDSVHAEKWGFHRAVLWDYDGSGKQHLIVSTDKGLLFLLTEEQPLGSGGKFEFRSSGPLADETGKVIRIYNRLAAAPLDLNGDGRQDLVLAAATYQMGGEKNPGCGIYYSLNLGVEEDGRPRLSAVQKLETVGHEHPSFVNGHAQLQTLDLEGKGERVVIVATQGEDSFRGYVYRPRKGKVGLEHTGIVLPPFTIEERLLDLDGDGALEYVRSGSEWLLARYGKVIRELKIEN